MKTKYGQGDFAGTMKDHTMPTAQPAFFRNLQALGAVPFHGGKSNSHVDPLAAAKEKFAKAADAQMKMIESSAAKGLWFRRDGDAVIVTLKNGMAAINREAPSFALANDAQAIKFIKAAKDACAKGDFDELLLATNRVPRKANDGGAAAQAQTPAPAQPAVVTATAAAKRAEK